MATHWQQIQFPVASALTQLVRPSWHLLLQLLRCRHGATHLAYYGPLQAALKRGKPPVLPAARLLLKVSYRYNAFHLPLQQLSRQVP